jgi:hypothetical protein
VLHYLPTNLSAREIAGELYLSVNHRQDAAAPVSKLGARSRTQAVEQARALGLLAPFLSQAPIGGSGRSCHCALPDQALPVSRDGNTQARSALEVLIFPERTRCLPRAPRHAASRVECSPGRSRSSHLHRRLPGRNDLRYAEKLRITRGIHAS